MKSSCFIFDLELHSTHTKFILLNTKTKNTTLAGRVQPDEGEKMRKEKKLAIIAIVLAMANLAIYDAILTEQNSARQTPGCIEVRITTEAYICR